MSAVSVVRAADHGSLAWKEVPRPPGDDTPPGEDVVVFESAEGRFSCGLWRRPIREGEMTRPFDEVSIIIDGVVEVVGRDGVVHRAEPGDVLITPRGSTGIWRCVTPVKKFWVICETDTERPGTAVIRRGDELDWQEVPRPEGDTAPPGEEVVLFRTADGRAACGFWRPVPGEGRMEPPHDEITYLLEGEVEVTEDGGVTHTAGPGDVLVSPLGTAATWRSLSPVRTFWAIFKP